MTVPRESLHQPDLFRWREAAGLYQHEAAQIAGVSLSAWRNYENGRRPVPQWVERQQRSAAVTRDGNSECSNNPRSHNGCACAPQIRARSKWIA